MNQHHSLLLKRQLRQNNKDQPRKKRGRKVPEILESIAVDDDSSDSSDDLEDVDIGGGDADLAATDASSIERFRKQHDVNVNGTNQGKEAYKKEKEDENDDDDDLDEESDEDDDFDDLEDVDLDVIFNKPPPESETLTININQKEDQPEKKKTKRFVPVPKAERHRRKLVHQLYLETMMAHGVVRNQWCNDKELQSELRQKIPPDVFEFLRLTNLDVLDYVKARRFIEAIRKAAAFYHRKFRVSSQGLVRKDWEKMLQKQEGTDGVVTLNRFRRLVKNFRGSRDIAAQGFVALLRSMGVTARLVFSLQPPDYRSIVPVGASKEDEKQEKEEDTRAKTKKSEFDPVFIPNLKRDFLRSARSSKEQKENRRKATFPTSQYPIFWTEVWNKFSKKWITVDPIVLNVVEIMPMRRRCKFEPPATESTNQTWYVIAYDNKRNVKDVTRRYTQYYNAKTVKKRIEFASDEDEHWYLQLLRSARPERTIPTEAEILETKEFYDRDICEGIPNNMTDFKNHPVYALESQLRQDEVIYPNDETSKCGTFKPMNKNTTMTVFKRSHVFRLRTPKAWHMRGRVLKVGVQPLKTKTVNRISFDDDGDDDGIERLYAEFQTEMYKAPPIVDGKITKNAYGNLEIYTPTMMPENGYLVKMTDTITMKMLEKAARDILRIDYAKAIVAFDFGGSKKNRTPTAREGGIVIDKQFQEAMELVVEHLLDMAEEEKRRQVELNALRSWKFFMKKLEIMNRLDRQHGKLDEEEEENKENLKEEREEEMSRDEEDGYFSVASDGESSTEENYVPRRRRRFVEEDEFEEGGFMLGDGGFEMPNKEELSEETFEVKDEQDNEDGGFLHEAQEVDQLYDDSEGGFVQDVGLMEEEKVGDFKEEGGYFEEDAEGGFFSEVSKTFLGETSDTFSQEPSDAFSQDNRKNLADDTDTLHDIASNKLTSKDSLKFGSDTESSFTSKPVSLAHSVEGSSSECETQILDRANSQSPSPDADISPTLDSDKSPTLDSDKSSKSVLYQDNLSPSMPSGFDNFATMYSCADPHAESDGTAAGALETRESPGCHKHLGTSVEKTVQPQLVEEIDSDEPITKGAETHREVYNISSEESVIEISDMSDIEKEEEELGLVYSDSE